MPHQCVVCGTVYPNGSKEILSGCSVCGGRKFYYISEPVAKEELGRISQQVEGELDNIVDTILKEVPKERFREDGTPDEDGEWARVEPEKGISPSGGDADIEVDADVDMGGGEGTELGEGDVGRVERVKRLKDSVSAGVVERIRFSGERAGDARGTLGHKGRVHRRKLRVSRGHGGVVRKDRPAVVTVVERGVYEINLRALLERSPIVIQKDGSYLIHLPTLFSEVGKVQGGDEE